MTVTYELRYHGHTLDVFDTVEGAIEARRSLVANIRVGRVPGFLDADDIEGEGDFQIVRCTYR